MKQSPETGRTKARDAFERGELQTLAGQLRRTIILAALFSLLGFILDLLIYPDYLGAFIICRIVVVVLILTILIPLKYCRRSHLLVRLLSHWLALLPMLAITFFISYAKDAGSPYYAGLNLVLVAASLLLRWRFSDSVINAILCISTYVILIVFLPGNSLIALSNLFFIAVTAVFTSAGTYYFTELRFQEFLLRDELDANRRALEENNAKLQALDEAKTRFFANISHELRTPLTLILGPVETLKTLPSLKADPKARDTLETLSENGFRLLRLINDLLDLVRLDTGDLPLRRENIDLPEFLGQLATSLKPMAEKQQISLTLESRMEEHPVLFYDRDRLEKIILNLSINALKFTPAGGKVELGLTEDGGQFLLTVKDNGRGMSREDLNRIFERFWQADASTKRKARGTGIGLALVKSLTESLDGEISVESTSGKGTTFTLRFPIYLPEIELSEEQIDSRDPETDEFDVLHEKARFTAASSEQHHTAQASGQNDSTQASDGQSTVLVVDDESGMRHFICSQLEDYHILQASDGKQGWELAKQHIPGLIVLDLMMPEMDGMEVCRKLRSHPPTSRIPIILVTAHAGDAPRLEAIEAGVNDFITKPFSSIELRARVRNLLLSASFERDLSTANLDLSQALEQLRENEEQLVRAEKLSSLGRMSAGIVHEVNNPLNYAKTSIHILKSYSNLLPDDEKEDYEDTLLDLTDGVERVINIVTDLRAFTRGDETTRHLLFLHKVVQNTRRLLASDLSGINFECEVPENLQFEGNDNQLCQAFVNLIQNALRAIEGCKNPTIRLIAEASPAGGIMVQVQDNGVGIPAENQHQIFDPFFTTRDVGDGMGLGLSLTLRIIEEHGGKIHVESEEGEGTTFIIYFPPAPESSIN